MGDATVKEHDIEGPRTDTTVRKTKGLEGMPTVNEGPGGMIKTQKKSMWTYH